MIKFRDILCEMELDKSGTWMDALEHSGCPAVVAYKDGKIGDLPTLLNSVVVVKSMLSVDKSAAIYRSIDIADILNTPITVKQLVRGLSLLELKTLVFKDGYEVGEVPEDELEKMRDRAKKQQFSVRSRQTNWAMALYRGKCPALVDFVAGKISKHDVLNSMVVVIGVNMKNVNHRIISTTQDRIKAGELDPSKRYKEKLDWNNSGVDVNALINHPILVRDLIETLSPVWLQNLVFSEKYEVTKKANDLSGADTRVMRQWYKLPERDDIQVQVALKAIGISDYDLNSLQGHGITHKNGIGNITGKKKKPFWARGDEYLWNVLELARKKFRERLKFVHGEYIATGKEDELRNLVRAWLIVQKLFKNKGYEFHK